MIMTPRREASDKYITQNNTLYSPAAGITLDYSHFIVCK